MASRLHSLPEPLLRTLVLDYDENYGRGLRSADKALRAAVVAAQDGAPAPLLVGGLRVDWDLPGAREGLGPPAVLDDRVVAFRAATSEFHVVARLPEARCGAAVCALPDGRIFVAGGVTQLGRNAAANPGVFASSHRSMLHQPNLEAGTRTWRGRQAAQCGMKTDSAGVLDLATGAWTELAPVPERVSGARAFSRQFSGTTKVFVVGGSVAEMHEIRDERGSVVRELGEQPFSRTVLIYDVGDDAWSELRGGLKRPRTEFALAVVPPGRCGFLNMGGVVVAGGTNKYKTGKDLSVEICHFGDPRMRWFEIDPIPNEDYRVARFERYPERMSCGGALVVAGGEAFFAVAGGLSLSEHLDDDRWEDEPGDDDSDDSRVAGSSHYSAESYEGDDDEYDEFGGAPRLSRTFDVAFLSLRTMKWVPNGDLSLPGFSRAVSASAVFGALGARALVQLGGDREYYEHDRHYPTHSTSFGVARVDCRASRMLPERPGPRPPWDPEGRRHRAPAAKRRGGDRRADSDCLAELGVAAAGVATVAGPLLAARAARAAAGDRATGWPSTEALREERLREDEERLREDVRETRRAAASRPRGACDVCGADARAKCGRCGQTAYCSPACQRAAWPTHKATCAARS